MSLYHFTSGAHWIHIAGDGVLHPSESNIDPATPHAGPPVVWLTDTPTADLGHGLDGSDVDKTSVRIEVDVPAIRWVDWEWTARMPNWWRDVMVRAGGGTEAAAHWWVWPARIPRSRWVDVEDYSAPMWGQAL